MITDSHKSRCVSMVSFITFVRFYLGISSVCIHNRVYYFDAVHVPGVWMESVHTR